jgi:hypothetical protein
VAGDYADATSTAEATSKSGADAALTGGLRIGAVLLVTVGIGGGAFVWRRRRAASSPVADEAEDAADAATADADDAADAAADDGDAATREAPSGATTSQDAPAYEPSAQAPPTEEPPS